jgi:hypothetical protein
MNNVDDTGMQSAQKESYIIWLTVHKNQTLY